MKLSWSRRAVTDLGAIAAYIADDNPAAARRWIDALRMRARRAAASPGPAIREVIHGRYRIIYRAVRVGIVVLHVTEGHRRLPSRDDL